jgi:GMP synthase (glutamine-hydrolysing)
MIVVLDYGSQYCHLLARRIRALGVYAEILPNNTKVEDIRKLENVEGVILSGGPNSVYEENAPSFDKAILELGVPVLGVCYGHQLLAHVLGGKVVQSSKEYGKEVFNVTTSIRLLDGLGTNEQVWMSHGDSVVSLPEGFSVAGETGGCKIAAYVNERKKVYGLQFHPEVQHTTSGKLILGNFLKICGCSKDYTIRGRDGKIISEVKTLVGDESVIMGVSGGVDSLVASVLIRKSTANIHCIFVDNGLVRKDEGDYVKKLYSDLGFDNFYYEDSSQLFLSRLKGITDPEEKRKIIGNTFIEVFDKKVCELKGRHGEITFLGQGTIYPDRIESAKASEAATVIKTHHNVGGLPEDMKLKLVEPLKDLYKDEVREVGKLIGLSNGVLMRHPFPGPGLAVRIVGEVTEDKISVLREADAIYIDELKKSRQYDKIWQAFAALMSGKAVGVMGDSRSQGYIIALRAVNSVDGMTADWSEIPREVLEKISSRIVKEVKDVTRVLYDITQKPPATIEFE